MPTELRDTDLFIECAFVGGEWIARAGRTLPVEDPATGKVAFHIGGLKLSEH